MNADSIKIECEEDGFWLVIEHDERDIMSVPGKSRVRIQNIAEEFYDHIKASIGPWLAEKQSARLAFLCAPEDIDESGGYDISDPKHPEFHSVHADLWDSRAGK